MAPFSRENSGVDAMKPVDGPQPIEIVFSFDTTGSMGSCIAEVSFQNCSFYFKSKKYNIYSTNILYSHTIIIRQNIKLEYNFME